MYAKHEKYQYRSTSMHCILLTGHVFKFLARDVIQYGLLFFVDLSKKHLATGLL